MQRGMRREGRGLPAPREGARRFFYLFWNHAWKLIRLNLLFLACCIPVVTMPAALCAMDRALIVLVREGNVLLWEEFRDEFKKDFWRSLPLGLLFGGLLFLGILLSVVFLFGTVLIMYYKQISEGYEDQDRFNILMKVGMTKKEVKQTINSQVLTVFFMPLIMAGIHLAFAFPMIQKILMLMSGVEAKVFVIVTIGCYLVFALFYVLVYVVTSKSYYTIISSKEK